MKHNLQSSALKELMALMGQALLSYIEKQGPIVEFAKKAGVNRVTLYRLLEGRNTGTENLLRVLRALGRLDVIESLVTGYTESPMERLQESGQRAQANAASKPVDMPVRLVDKLKLGHLEGKPHEKN